MAADLKEISGSVAATLIASKLEQPDLDNRSYRVIQLPNRLEALIVHDPDTDKASAALDVHVGNFSDNEDLPGQAHAVEHLLFMGTQKYPKENEYSEYLSQNSGHSNAYTAATSTNYFFEIGHEHFYGALDRFAQFFISPLFLAETLDRELRAVDSENKKNLQNDTWRLHQLSKSLSNPNHPYCHFSTGNLDTLKELPSKKGVNVRDEFLKFHDKYYSSNVMKLVVLGREDLDTLQSWVMELFEGVKNKDLPDPVFDGQPFTDKELLTQYFAKPVMDTRSLDITFPFLDEEKLFKTQPSRYAAHLIGHEGPGSILAYLKKKGWANALNAGPTSVCNDAAFFYISVRLTEDGLEHYEEVTKIVFQYINLIRSTHPQEWIMKELQAVAAMDFKFRQKSPASKFTSRLSAVMQRPLPREWLLSGTSLIREFDPELIKKSMDYLTPENFRLSIVSQKCARGDWEAKEKWYGTEYRVENIPDKFLKEIQSTAIEKGPGKELENELFLPHKNEFIPTNFDVERKDVKVPAKIPVLIKNTELSRLWYKKDDTFWVPKANVFCTLRSPLVYATPGNAVKARLYSELVKDALNEYAYDAEIAGLEYTLGSHSLGLDIELGGYNDKMLVLLEKLLIKMRDLVVCEDRFKIIKERTVRGYKNWDYAQPYYQIGEYARYLHAQLMWMNDEYLAELDTVTAQDIQEFFPQILKQTHIEALVHGNLYKEDALKLTNLIETILNPRSLPATQFGVRRSLIMPPGARYVYPRQLKDEKNVNSAIEFSLSIGEHSEKKLRALTTLFSQMTEEPAFDQLRTKEQLGYVVFSGARLNATTMIYRILIQSEHSAPYLESRIENFLALYKATLEKMTDKDIKTHVSSLIAKRLERMKNLNQESTRLWNYISSEYYNFLQIDTEVEILRSLTKADVISFYDTYISTSSPQRSKISVHMHAAATPPPPVAVGAGQAKTMLTAAVVQFLTTAGIVVDEADLAKKFENVDISGVESITAVIKKYLEDLKTPSNAVEKILAAGSSVLEQLLPKLLAGGPPEVVDANGDAQEIEKEAAAGSQGEIIEDVYAFKAGLAITKAARPVKPLVEFEESCVKL